MPIYEYQCVQCETVTDIKHGFKEAMNDVCPACGGALKRVFRPAGILFKGSGFYVTDSRKASESAASAVAKSDGAKADAAKTDASKSDASKSDASKSDAPKADASKGDAPKSESKSEAKSGSTAKSDSGGGKGDAAA